MKCAKLNVGNKMLLQKTTYKGKHKISNGWENQVYIVISKPFQNLPVFRIKPEIGEGKIKVVHKNLFLL